LPRGDSSSFLKHLLERLGILLEAKTLGLVAPPPTTPSAEPNMHGISKKRATKRTAQGRYGSASKRAGHYFIDEELEL